MCCRLGDDSQRDLAFSDLFPMQMQAITDDFRLHDTGFSCIFNNHDRLLTMKIANVLIRSHQINDRRFFHTRRERDTLVGHAANKVMLDCGVRREGLHRLRVSY